MPKLDSTRYTILFATVVCVVCALLVSVSAVGLASRQEENARLYRQKNVLLAAGLVEPGVDISAAEILRVFDANIDDRADRPRHWRQDRTGGHRSEVLRPAQGSQRPGAVAPGAAQQRGPAAAAQHRRRLLRARARRASNRSCCPSRAAACGACSPVSSHSTATATRCAASPSTSRRRRRASAGRSPTRSGRHSGAGARRSTRTSRPGSP